MAKRRTRKKPRLRGVTQRVNQRQVTIVHVGDKKGKRVKRRRKPSAAEAATAAISASMGRPVDLGLMDPQLQAVLHAHNTMQRQTLYNTPWAQRLGHRRAHHGCGLRIACLGVGAQPRAY